MLRFLASNLDQLDLACEHVSQGDANNARFGLMLIDNVVEITLHQIAKDTENELGWFYRRDEPYAHAADLEDALGRDFGPKVRFAQKIGKLEPEVSETLNVFHTFRNEVYHIGLQHEAILPTITKFYFHLGCDFLGSYSPRSISFSPGMALPQRAEKYFHGGRFFNNAITDYQTACGILREKILLEPVEL